MGCYTGNKSPHLSENLFDLISWYYPSTSNLITNKGGLSDCLLLSYHVGYFYITVHYHLPLQEGFSVYSMPTNPSDLITGK